MFELRNHTAWLRFCCIAGLAPAAFGAPSRVSVADLLRAFTATGANVIYSSELVPPTLDAADLTEGDAYTRLEEALAANGLSLQRTGDRTYVVTRTVTRPAALSAAPTTVAAHPRPVPLEEISVFASRYEFTSGTDEPSSFDQRQIKTMPGAKSDSLRALRAAPGLATNLSARPYVRGAQLDDVLVEFDGIAIADPYHFRDFQSVMSIFSPDTVSHADVYSGGYPVNYGTRSGGVIDLAPAAMQSGYEYAFGASMLSYDVETLGHAADLPLDWLFVARASSDDRVLQRLLSENGEPDFYDVLGRVRWSVDATSTLTLGWLFLNDKVTFDSDAPEEHAYGQSKDSTAWLRWDWTPAPALTSHTSIALADTQRDNRGSLVLPGVAMGTLRAERSFTSATLRSDWAYAPTPRLTYRFGGEFTGENADLSFYRRETFSDSVAASFGRATHADVTSDQTPHSTTAGLYGSVHRRWNAFEAELGLRADAQVYRGFGMRRELTPRVNLRYDLSDHWHAYGSWGQFTQAQRVDEYRGELNQVAPDPVSRAVHSIIGFAYQTPDSLILRMEAYRHHWSTISPYLDNALGPISLLPQLEADRVVVAPADADAVGVEISAQRNFNDHWSAWGSYTRSTVTDDSHGREIERSWDQAHSANAGVTWTRSGTSLAALVSWHSGWPKTPVALTGTPPQLIVGTRNSMHWGGYFSADMRMSTSVALPLGELSLWMDATNLTNRRNYCCVSMLALEGDAVGPDLRDTVWSPRVVDVGFTFRVRRLR